MNTTEQEHHKMVHELIKDPSTIVTDPDKIDLNHMALGVMGEIGEIAETLQDIEDINHLWEECGDLEFYLCHLRNIWITNRTPSPAFVFHSTQSIVFHLVISGGHLVDVIKKHTIYGQQLDIERGLKFINALDTTLDNLYGMYGVSRDKVLQGNIDKLRKRYPVGYSDAAAKMRADKLEDINLQQDADYRKMREENSVDHSGPQELQTENQ